MVVLSILLSKIFSKFLEDVIAKKTKIPKKFLVEKEDVDVFFTIEECVKYKITDFVVED